MIPAIISSLNIGRPKSETFGHTQIRTGLCKEAVHTAIPLTAHGFAGDGVHNKKYHGGPDKAVCFYSADHYPFWEELLGRPMPAAAFGENITIAGITEQDVAIGDIFTLGTATIQISQPRQPCKTLAARYQHAELISQIIKHGFTGWYARVVGEGEVRAADAMVHQEAPPNRLTIAEANRIFHGPKKAPEALQRLLAAPGLSDSWQQSVSRLVARSAAP